MSDINRGLVVAGTRTLQVLTCLVLACLVLACNDSPDIGPRTESENPGKGSDSDNSGDSDASGTSSDSSVSADSATMADAAVLGQLSAAIGSGTFWKYGWDSYRRTSSGFGSSSSESEDSGVFWLELGEATDIGGVTMYEIILSGDASMGETPVTRWQYLGIADNRIYVSQYGTDVVELFDAQDGQWSGAGFFSSFDASQTFTGYQTQISNDYISADAIAVSASASSDQCSYDRITGQTFCDDTGSVNDQKKEYYSLSLGVIGYYRYFSYSELSYDSQYSSTEEVNIGLMGSSLQGDAIDKPVQIAGITPESGTYNGAQTISVTTVPADASIRYTTDGTDPSALLGTEVTGSAEKTFLLDANAADLRIVAVAPGMTDSEIVQRSYAIINTIDFVADGEGALQLYVNDPEQYGWYYYDVRPEYTFEKSLSHTIDIELTRLSGSDSMGAGMIFGAQSTDIEQYFAFLITPNGYYELFHWDDVDGDAEIIPWTASSAILTGMNQRNVLTATSSQTPAGVSVSLSINGTVVDTVYPSQSVGLYSGFIAFIGTEEVEDFPAVPLDIRFRMHSPIEAP
ncbi:MAG: chitobiase/beta-hexosaminidase C-terminal domain-containing protein [Deltaproteobacteria bacterium]|nr:chitobiase/beta-hexosaminidase C-terminal domain-containing protein [Deltaproteobacteria bacterium]